MKHNRKNDQYVIEHRRYQVAGLYLKGWSQFQIAKEIKCSQQQVSIDLRNIRQDWLDSSLQDFNAKKAKELAKLDYLELVAWEAWDRSRGKAESNLQKTEKALRSPGSKESNSNTLKMVENPGYGRGLNTLGNGSPPVPISEMVTVKVIDEKKTIEQNGDPRFLQQVGWCIETRVKILGLIEDVTINNNNLNFASLLGAVSSRVNPIDVKLHEVAALPSAEPHQNGTNGFHASN